jgi:uncharacterized protein (TIGR03083 family)
MNEGDDMDMFGAAYKAGQQRVSAFVADKDPDRIVPACPDWSVTDVVRHLAGISSDATNLVFDGFASDEWTDAQVSSRRQMSMDQVLDEWDSTIDTAVETFGKVEELEIPDTIDSALGPMPKRVLPATAVSDILHHEFDIRNAFGDTSGRDLLEVHQMAGGHVRSLRPYFAMRGLPTIRIESTDAGEGWNVGRDEPVAVGRSTSFEILRGIGGRRTRDEMLAWEWEGDAEQFVDAMILPHLSMRTESLNE